MSLSKQIVTDRYIVVRGEGELTADDFIELNRTLYSEADESIVAYQIVDLTAVSGVEVSTDDIRAIAEQDKNAVRSFGRIVIAVVVSRDLEYGLSRMWEAFADTPGIETRVFRDMTTAEQWILGRIAE